MIPSERQKKLPEIIAPGGSFESATSALHNGADGVYIGLKSFSARSHAENFTIEEIAKLKSIADAKNKKIYVTLNTVIPDYELEKVCGVLCDLALLGIDGIVVQDIGIASVILRYFPNLPVHASTQMAVYSGDGIDFLKRLGFKRIILSRELTFGEISELRRRHTDIELEVFIHGSLCYSFSGLCLASGMLLGRSGNSGDCAQVCRSWFESEGGKGYYFSCNDLHLGVLVRKLADIGIDGLKIEGRMKPPGYAAAASAYYRAILRGEDPQATDKLLRSIKTVFSRNNTPGFFSDSRGKDMINAGYPGHVGIPIGTVQSVTERSFFVDLTEHVARFDGLLFFTPGKSAEPFRFGVRALRIGNKSVFEADKGDHVEIECEKKPEAGAYVYKISSSGNALKSNEAGSAGPRKLPLKIDVAIRANMMDVSCKSGLQRIFGESAKEPGVFSFPVKIEKSTSGISFDTILEKVFRESGDSRFIADTIVFSNNGDIDGRDIFIPPSQLKKIKNEFYGKLADYYDSLKTGTSQRIIDDIDKRIGAHAVDNFKGRRIPPGDVLPREQLTPNTEKSVPFVISPERFAPENPAEANEIVFLPLAPVTINSPDYLSEISAAIGNNPGREYVIGLSNYSHLEWISSLSRLPGISFFIDFPLYCANRASFEFFLSTVPSLRFVYDWIEESDEDFTKLKTTLGVQGFLFVRTGDRFKPPLFLSRICYRRHGLGQKCKGKCPIDEGNTLVQNKRRYRLVTRECITYLFEKDKNQ